MPGAEVTSVRRRLAAIPNRLAGMGTWLTHLLPIILCRGCAVFAADQMNLESAMKQVSEAHFPQKVWLEMESNEVRLWLSVIAYNLGNLWRRLALPRRIGNWSITSLQQRLVKTGGRLVKHARYYWLLLAEGVD